MISSARGALVVATQTLKAHKLRTTLTCLSLVIAVLAFVAVDAASQVAADAVVAQARLTQGMPETWKADIPAGPTSLVRATRARVITQSILGPAGGSAVLTADAMGRTNGNLARVVAVRGDLLSIRPFRVLSGRWLEEAAPSLSPEVVLNSGVASGRIGGTIPLTLPGLDHPITARVAGIVNDASQVATIYVSMDNVLVWTAISPVNWSVQALAHSSDDSDIDPAGVLAYALSVVGLAATPARIDQLGATADVLATVRLTFLLVAAVALLVGILGIVNIGLASLRERVEEIALRRATGATRMQIAATVLAESVIGAVTAAGLAVMLAWLLLPLLTSQMFSELPMASSVGFPAQTAFVGIIVAGLAGFAGGIIPASKAARMDIANVMRG